MNSSGLWILAAWMQVARNKIYQHKYTNRNTQISNIMKFNISSFTHIGTKRQINQDRILANDKILSDGFYSLDNQTSCFCFVADGIGGGLAGEIASQFVLDAILKQKENFHKLEEEIIEEELYSVNNELINLC
jgi:serine/threonine protein phosphatase PrpC